MKKIALLFIGLVGFIFTGVAQEDIILREVQETEISFDAISVNDTKTGEILVAVGNTKNFSEGEIVAYKRQPGKAHFGSASSGFVLVEIFPIEDPTTIGSDIQLARVGFKKGKVTFGGGTTTIDK